MQSKKKSKNGELKEYSIELDILGATVNALYFSYTSKRVNNAQYLEYQLLWDGLFQSNLQKQSNRSLISRK